MMACIKGKNGTMDYVWIFEQYYRGLAYFAYRLLKDREAGEDVVQDVFVMLFEKGVPFEKSGVLKSFLYITVRNRCLDYLKHQKVVEKHQADSLLVGKEPSHDSIWAALVESETLSIVKEAIDQLPCECAKVMHLVLLEYNSIEIAEKLDVEPSTVRAQKQRGLLLLKKYIPQHLFVFVFGGMI
ncbi:hypothetical protein DMB45_04845 [Sanguibacteroides justesenii]|uniref:RNA polymerase sigma-70 region 2 domain-containing protein n=2 Tax=Sanguibacteroides justesenii TaxID=1547597 RepID=A0A0C3NDW6_9PORP|nr:hypothetical protein BA92_08825 [Sanguibacteroides justesenii]PXZ44767.1 hypothetical protein DMB45_04845 [Sanguibacteroides justesenii]